MAMGNKGLARLFSVILLLALGISLFFPLKAEDATTNIINTKHNLSVSGPGPIKSLTESRICVFCHTPHNATPDTPLWNKEIQALNYSVYTSPTLKTPQPLLQPFGPTKLCLSCHDGTIALGTIVGGANLGLTSALPSTSPTYFGLNLSTHHPVSFSYYTSLPNAELVNVPPPNLNLGGADAEVHCTTCHDPHDNSYGNFLAMNNSYSALCTACHQMTGWNVSGHATIQQGCEACHTPHFALASPLLNYTSSDYCLTCHSPVPTPPPSPIHGVSSAAEKSSVTAQTNAACLSACHSPISSSPSELHPIHAESLSDYKSLALLQTAPTYSGIRADIKGQITKSSGHRERRDIDSNGLRSVKGAFRSAIRSVTCVDCHNPHAANRKKALAPNASGMLGGVRGVDKNGMDIASVTYEYEVCFKCHGDYSSTIQYVPRVINTTNMRLAFDQTNPSYHPVIGTSRNVIIPSIPSPLEPALNVSDIIYCTDCHRDDAGGSKGPHGSSFPPVLRERYETADGTPESYANYALCYRCHNRASILNDVSFRKKIRRATPTGGGHSGHLAAGAPCSACHDPHGINTSMMNLSKTGSHEHLINFDSRTVLPIPRTTFPLFTNTGTFSGSCTLVCHGKTHINLSYP